MKINQFANGGVTREPIERRESHELILSFKLWDRITAFLASGANGQIIMDVQSGAIKSCRITEYVRDDDGVVDSPHN